MIEMIKIGPVSFWALLLSLSMYGWLVPVSSFAQEPGGSQPKIAWEHFFGDDEFVYRPDIIAQTENRLTLLIGGIKTPTGDNGKNAKFWLIKVSSDGKLLQEIEIATPASKENLAGSSPFEAYTYIRGIVPLSKERILLILNVYQGHSMVILDKSGTPLLVKSLGVAKKPWHVFKVLETPDHNLLLVGRLNGDGYIMKMDLEGKEIWKKLLDRGKTETFWDGVRAGESNYVLIGNSNDKFPGPSTLSVIKISTEGLIQKEVQWDEWFGSIARDREGLLGVIYNKTESFKQDVWLKVLDASLKQQSETQLGTSPMGVEQFRIIAAPGGGVLSGGHSEGL